MAGQLPESVFGTEFVSKDGTVTREQFKGKKIGLYFSAHWYVLFSDYLSVFLFLFSLLLLVRFGACTRLVSCLCV